MRSQSALQQDFHSGPAPRDRRRRRRMLVLGSACASVLVALLAWQAARPRAMAYAVQRSALLLPVDEGLVAAVAVRDAREALAALLASSAFREAEARAATREAMDELWGGAAGRVRRAVREHPSAGAAVLSGDAAIALYRDGVLIAFRTTASARGALRCAPLLGLLVERGPLGDGSFHLHLGREPLVVLEAGEHLVVGTASSMARLRQAAAQSRRASPPPASVALAEALARDGDAIAARFTTLASWNIAALDVSARRHGEALRLRLAYTLAAPLRAPGIPVADQLDPAFPPETPLYLAVNDGPFFFLNHGGARGAGLGRLLAELTPEDRADLERAEPRFSLAVTGLVERGRAPPAPILALGLQGQPDALARGLSAFASRHLASGFRALGGAGEGRPFARWASDWSPLRLAVSSLPGGAVLVADDRVELRAATRAAPAQPARALVVRGDGASLARLARRVLAAEAATLPSARGWAVSEGFLPVLDRLPSLGAFEGALDARPGGATGEIRLGLAR